MIDAGLSPLSGQMCSDHPLDLSPTHGTVDQAGGAAGAREEMSARNEHDLRGEVAASNNNFVEQIFLKTKD